jgi:nucleotide-binding universal stress UspA family protein
MRNLLVGVDPDGRSDAAVLAARRLADRVGGELELARAAEVPTSAWVGIAPDDFDSLRTSILEHARDEAAAQLEALEGAHGLEAGALTRHAAALPGKPTRALLDRAANWPADVLFLGWHARRGVFDFGSTARALIQSSPCALWVQPCEAVEIERLLVPLDLSRPSLDAARVACRLARTLDVPVELLHAFSPPQLFGAPGQEAIEGWPTYTIDGLRDAARERFEAAAEELRSEGAVCSARFCEGSPEESILERQAPEQLVVMGTKGHTGLAGMLLGNTTWSILRTAGCPVLAVRTTP